MLTLRITQPRVCSLWLLIVLFKYDTLVKTSQFSLVTEINSIPKQVTSHFLSLLNYQG